MCIYYVFTSLCSFSITAQKENNISVADGTLKASEMLFNAGISFLDSFVSPKFLSNLSNLTVFPFTNDTVSQ